MALDTLLVGVTEFFIPTCLILPIKLASLQRRRDVRGVLHTPQACSLYKDSYGPTSVWFTKASFCLAVLIAPGNVKSILEVYLNTPWLGMT